VDATAKKLVERLNRLEDERFRANQEIRGIIMEVRTAFTVRARLVGYRHETDKDFHIVIADLQDLTVSMVVEIPDSQCAGVCASPKLREIQQAREKFVKPFPTAQPAPEFVVVQGDVEVEVTGVGFFDFAHGQTGLAHNCIELHPVLDINFPQPGPFQAKIDPAGEPPKRPESW